MSVPDLQRLTRHPDGCAVPILTPGNEDHILLAIDPWLRVVVRLPVTVRGELQGWLRFIRVNSGDKKD